MVAHKWSELASGPVWFSRNEAGERADEEKQLEDPEKSRRNRILNLIMPITPASRILLNLIPVPPSRGKIICCHWFGHFPATSGLNVKHQTTHSDYITARRTDVNTVAVKSASQCGSILEKDTKTWRSGSSALDILLGSVMGRFVGKQQWQRNNTVTVVFFYLL